MDTESLQKKYIAPAEKTANVEAAPAGANYAPVTSKNLRCNLVLVFPKRLTESTENQPFLGHALGTAVLGI